MALEVSSFASREDYDNYYDLNNEVISFDPLIPNKNVAKLTDLFWKRRSYDAFYESYLSSVLHRRSPKICCVPSIQHPAAGFNANIAIGVIGLGMIVLFVSAIYAVLYKF
jgi:hypothetical protein